MCIHISRSIPNSKKVGNTDVPLSGRQKQQKNQLDIHKSKYYSYTEKIEN